MIILVPHFGAPFDQIKIFTSLEKAMAFWSFLENRECVEFHELTFDGECWNY